MKKAICIVITIILMLALSSCMVGVPMAFLRDSDDEYAEARMEKLFNAIKGRDKDAIKAEFSKKAITETKDFDADLDNLLSFVKGNAVSWAQDGSSRVSDVSESNGYTKRLMTWYNLYTDEQNYLFFIVDYPIDTINIDHAGIYSLRILKAEDEDKLEGYVEDWEIPGIYILK